MTLEELRKPTKFVRSRSLGEQRANKRIKKFLITLRDMKTRHKAGHNLWLDVLYSKSRDTKEYYRYLVLRLSYIAYEFAIGNDEKYLKETVARHLKKIEEYLAE